MRHEPIPVDTGSLHLPSAKARWSAAILGLTVALGLTYPFRTEQTVRAGILLDHVLTAVEQKYVRPIKDVDELFYDSLDDALRSLDRNSRFFSPSEAEQFEGDTEGFYVGIGIVTGDGQPTPSVITAIVKGGPAEAIGLLRGDLIIAVNGEVVADKPRSEVQERIKGEPRTAVWLRVRRDGKELEFLVERRRVAVPSVRAIRLYSEAAATGNDEPGRIGYVRLDQFQPHSTDEVERAFTALIAEGADRLVLDLRNNGGGVLREAVSMVDLFVSSGVVLSTRGRANPDSPKLYNATSETAFATAPLCVLIDGYSASASEIVAAALQDLRRAVVIGSESFGKWTVQDVIPLGEGRGHAILKLTTKQFHPPLSRWVRTDANGIRKGIVPHLRVDVDDEARKQLAREWQLETYTHFADPEHISRLPMPSYEELDSGLLDAVLTRAVAVLSRPADLESLLASNPEAATTGAEQ